MFNGWKITNILDVGLCELEDLFQPPLSILNAAELGVELFGERGLKEIIQVETA
jgi:hypothetical protein